MKVILVVVISYLFYGCTTTSTINPGGCGTTPFDTVCLGETTVPSEHKELFLVSSNQAIDVISSQAFKDDLANFIKLHSTSGKHSAAWSGVDTTSIPQRLLQEVQGMQISTFGGIKGLFYKVFYGTKALEGDAVGPILLNRWFLPRSSASIANTIVHEAAHRIDFSHPSVKKDSKTANCEPPYLIGSLIEKHILGSNWHPNENMHCSYILNKE